MSTGYSSIRERKRSLNEFSQGIQKPVKKKQIFNHCITLSQSLVEYPQSFEDSKISVVQKFINEIDSLPKRFTKIETLYLSNNNIKTLEGLQQFSNLKNLSLANNEIDDAGSLNILEQLPSIEVLTLCGNPVCKLPNYRPLIISMLPCLRTLDGKPVTQDEKHKSEVNLRTQSGLLDLLLSNYCELIKMNNLQKKLELHQELLAKYPRFVKNFVPINVEKWKKMYDYESLLDRSQKNALKTNLLQDVSTIKNELRLKDEDNEMAFSELILRQQQKIGELVYKADSIAKNLAKNYSRDHGRKSVDLRPQELSNVNYNNKAPRVGSSSVSNKTKPKQVTIVDYAAANPILKSEVKSFKPTQKNGFRSPDTKGNDLFQRLNSSSIEKNDSFVSPKMSIQERLHTSQSSMNGKNAFISPKISTYIPSERPKSPGLHHSPMKIGISKMSRNTASSHKEECCRTVCRQVYDMDFETSRSPENKRYKSPFKKKLEEKERLIDNLAQDLRNKTQELIKFESLNAQLTAKLRNFQTQNNDNVKVAEEEIENVTQQLIESVQQQQQLQEEVDSLQHELEDLHRRNFDLEQRGRKLEEVEEKANTYARELEKRVIEENLLGVAHSFQTKQLKIRVFQMLKKAVVLHRNMTTFAAENNAGKSKKVLKSLFREWKRFTYLRRYIKEKAKQRVIRMQINMFYELKYRTLLGYKIKQFIQDRNERNLKRSIITWKQYLHKRAKKDIKQKKIAMAHHLKTKKKVFKKLVELRKRNYYDPTEEKIVTKKAQKYQAFYVRRLIFTRWQAWAHGSAKPLRLKKEASQRFLQKNLLKFGFRVLIQNRQNNLKTLQKAQRKIERKNKEIVIKHLKAWKLFMNQFLPAQRREQEKKETFIKKRLLKVWKNQYQLKQNFKTSLEKASSLYEKNLCKRVVRHLAKLRLKKKQLYFYKNVLSTTHSTLTMQRFFGNWSNLFKGITQARKQALEERKTELSIYLTAWKQFHKETIIKKTRKQTLERHLGRVERSIKENILFGLRDVTRLNQRNRGVLELFAARKRKNLCKVFLFELVKETKQGLKQNMARVLAKTALLEANLRDNLKFTKDSDSEKIDIRNKATLFQEEIAKLNMQVEERDREINNMRRALHQAEKNEKNYLDEISTKNSIIKELENKLHRNTSENQYVYGEYEKEIEILKDEKTNLLRKVSTLESEVSVSKKALMETEKMLLDNSNKTDGIVKDVEKKFANSVKMASEFRNVIEIKEDQVTSLIAQVQKLTEEKQDLKNKTNEALLITRETREFFEDRIKSLERQNLDLVSNVESYKDDINKQQKFISDLKTDLRKSQNRLEILSKKAHHEDQEFIRSLQKEANSFLTITQRIASPKRVRVSEIEKNRNDFSAERRQAQARKKEIDEKINILENYMSTNTQTSSLLSPKNPLSKVLGQNQFQFQSPPVQEFRNPLASSMRSFKTASTHFHDSENDIPTREIEATRLKTSDFASSIASDKSALNVHHMSTQSFQQRKRSPIQGKISPLRQMYRSHRKGCVSSINENEFEKMKKERIDRKEGLEKRLEDLTQSLRSDLQKARTRALE